MRTLKYWLMCETLLPLAPHQPIVRHRTGENLLYLVTKITRIHIVHTQRCALIHRPGETVAIRVCQEFEVKVTHLLEVQLWSHNYDTDLAQSQQKLGKSLVKVFHKMDLSKTITMKVGLLITYF